jgi:lipopolysaccharide transport system ATP-binding protein
MSSNESISVDGISKCYNVYDSPMDRLLQSLYPRAARMAGGVGAHRVASALRERRNFSEFWALRDVSFEVKRGETVGIVGRNGSGKSTLLQMIAGTLTPTQGSISVHGRIAALLELGSGFNPEFTGIENVHLNASVLGLTDAEIDQRMDSILAFADIGDFAKRPIKTYSSGMVVRLAFAVQAQVEPDILIVDEALSVGDAKFQAKCFARLETLKAAGTSILFVSHATEQVISHCDRAILLHDGVMHQQGKPKDVVHTYLDLLFGGSRKLAKAARSTEAKILGTSPEATTERSDKAFALDMRQGAFEERGNYSPYEYRWGNGAAQILDFRLIGPKGTEPSLVLSGDRLRLMLGVAFNETVFRPIFGLTIKTKDGITVYGSNTEMSETALPSGIGHAGTHAIVTFDFDCTLGPGDYFLSVGVASRDGEEATPHDRRYDAIHINVNDTGFFGLAKINMTMDAKEAFP